MEEKQKTERSTKFRCSQWSDLPTDVSDEINGRLNLYNQVRFHAVCKNWQAAQYIRKPFHLFPWLVYIPKSTNNIYEIQLYEPSHSHLNLTSVDKIFLHQFFSPQPYVNITYNYGWLLFSLSTCDMTCTNFLLYSVFTRKITTLPPLHLQKGHNVDLNLSFSAEPNSPDCVFLVLGTIGDDRCTVSTLTYGEKEWITKEFDSDYEICDGSMIVLISGVFYFVNTIGQIASYDITSGAWMNEYRLIPKGKKVFELDGNITCLDYGLHSRSLRRFDVSNKVWVGVKSLGNRALFVSDDNSFPVSTIGEEARSNGILANNIYRLTSSGFGAYSLKDGKLVKCGNGSGIKNWDITGKYMAELCCWIEPPDPLVKHKQAR